jgi:cellulose synthase/poly-beta-1,6-N-acetylglucosamine synthase-like glycosyltransferase/peptidoglycan/xylan/chitin deacetylase (PgdA/CDA1 family)/spore germination protein YaaH
MSAPRKNPVFYDPKQTRWPRLRRLFLLLSFLLSVLFGLLLLSFLVQPAMPALKLPLLSFLPLPGPANPAPPSPAPFVSPAQKAFKKSKEALEHSRRAKAPARVHRKTAPPPTPGTGGAAGAASAAPAQPLALAYFVNWDEASFDSLKKHLDQLDVLLPEWLHLSAQSGNLEEDNPARQEEVLQFLRGARPDLPVLPLLNNFSGGAWRGEELFRLLNDQTGRAKIIASLLQYLKQNHCGGACVDFEELPERAASAYEKFAGELTAALHKEKLLLALHLPLAGAASSSPLAKLADFVILIGYNEHWSTGAAGPIAGAEWFGRQLALRKAEVPPEKMILALGNFGYDWPRGQAGQPCSFEQGLSLAHAFKAEVHYDPASLNPFFTYAGQGGPHDVWLLDAVTAFNQSSQALAVHPRGLALWRLGGEDPSLWTFFGQRRALDGAAAQGLCRVQFDSRVDHAGAGEIMRFAARPQTGRRRIEFDPACGRISAAAYEELPSPCVVEHFGAANNKVALTFDDGPDPRFTPAILDILKAAAVPATFFIIGMNGEENPGLLQRILAEGHELGSHTFTHPNMAEISALQFDAELAATQRLLESVLSRQTLLFRAPYGEGDDAATAEQTRVLRRASELGYWTVGMNVDPDDWRRPGAAEIVRRVIARVEAGAGNIILLHDSGGDRAQTVEALPKLIKELRARGLQLVTVSNLLGLKRDDCLPPLPPGERLHAWINWLAFELLNAGHSLAYWFFLAGTLLGVLRLLLVGLLAWLEHRRGLGAVYADDYHPSVAVIVPAFNEEKVIVQTIRGLLTSTYAGKLEVLVVDDGSRDQTYEAATQAFAGDERVRIFRTPNGGKPAALNFGIARTQAEIIVTLDADTIFEPGTLGKLVRHFADRNVGAVAGNAKVGNRINLLTRWQALEYITSQNLDRRAFGALNCITVVPGAAGAWRRELVMHAGGFSGHTLAEDADLTLALRKQGHMIVNEAEAIAHTEAPDNLAGFVRQRYRWMFGTLQAAWKHKDALFRPRYGSLGFIALPHVFIFQVFFPFISPLMDLLALGSLGFGILSGQASFLLSRLLFCYALFVVADFLAAVLAFVLEPKEDRRLLLWLFWQRFFYRQLMYYVALKSLLASLRGIEVGWGRQERKATVTIDD